MGVGPTAVKELAEDGGGVMCRHGVPLMQNSWSQTLADGFIGAFLGSSVSVIVALYAIRRSQRIERENRREDLSLAAAERLTMALLDAVRRLNQLAAHDVSRSRASRAETMSAIMSELQTAVELHAPVLSPPAFASLPALTTKALDKASEAIEARERAVMQQERLSESDEDRAYAVDRNAAELRQILVGFLRDVNKALTAYRQGLTVTEKAVPAMPVLPTTPVRRTR
jgi:hypothetical protein